MQVLYLKNLHGSVTVADLEAVFGALKPSAQPDDMSWESPQIRLMAGRLRGQGFVTFPCKHILLNGSPYSHSSLLFYTLV